jgi:hypothetical protein
MNERRLFQKIDFYLSEEKILRKICGWYIEWRIIPHQKLLLMHY